MGRTGEERGLLITHANLVTLDESGRIIPDGALLIQESLIVEVGSTQRLSGRHPEERVVDAQGQLVMPGLINAHTHLYSTLARGMALKDEPPANFVQILERLWWRLDKALVAEDILYSALVALIDCIRHGTTTIVDHHASPGSISGSLDLIAQAIDQAGLRGCLCYEVSDRGGCQEAQAGIQENSRFIRRCQYEKKAMRAASFGLHASFTLSDETLRECVELAKDLDVGFHLHVAEDAADVSDARAKYGKSAVQRLADCGVLGPETLAIHCVHVDGDDMDILRETDTNVIHNPQSNCNNGVGVAPVVEMLNRGIRVGLGSDGFTANMFDEIRTANILHKLSHGDPRVGYAELLRMAFQNNRDIAGLFFRDSLGVIRPGAAADLIFLDYHPPTPLRPDNFLGHLLFGISGARVQTTIVAGNELMRNGQLVNLDEEQIAARARELASKLWERF
ncbi:MAG: chlorohydrolase [candidate division Zixibacteria bacterium SM23_81]|nr:MAG: chlorohydrolase [candidate division Zixibacteria bacterium SM23_81]